MSSINVTPPRASAKLMPSLSLIIVGIVVMVAGALALVMLVPYILPPQASTQAREVDSLFTFLIFIGGMVFILVEGLILVSVLRFGAQPGDTADGPPIQGNTTLEFVWTLIPAIIVAVLAIYSFVIWTNIRAVAANEFEVRATGARFAWTFTYDVGQENLPAGVTLDQLKPEVQTNLTDDDGVITFNAPRLYTWVGQPVVVHMTAQDVNHAFWIPAMRVKQDVLVGRTTDVRFTPTMAGEFRIVCAELCGSGHGAMAGEHDREGNLVGAWLIVYENEEEYLANFYNDAANTVLFPPDDPALVGRQILVSGTYPCNSCHALGDLGWVGNVGPNLNGIGARAADRAAQSGEADAPGYLVHSIRHPGDWLVPGFGNLMPQFNPDSGQTNYMPDADLNAIVAYLLTQTNPAGGTNP